MSAFDVHIMTVQFSGGTPTGALGTIPAVGSVPLFKAPADAYGGGLTILEAEISTENGGLGTFLLKTSSSAGTKDVTGTIATFGTSSLGAGSAYPMTIVTPWVDGGYYVYLAKTGSILVPGGFCSIKYVMGR